MKFYKIHPEVPGGLGANTIYNKDVAPWELTHPHLIFDGWLGGDILKISNCYLITEDLKKSREFSGLSGILSYEPIDIELSQTFNNLYPNKKLPKIYRIIINGVKGIDDFWMLDYYKLVISEKALNILKKYNISDMEIEEYFEI
jgi:hypothetical protein